MPKRDHVVAASETVTLVLGEDSSLPESTADVNDLVRHLRGHVARLERQTAPGVPVLLRAQRLSSEDIPEDDAPSRAYLNRLAEATWELITHVECGGHEPMRPPPRRPWWQPQINVWRGLVCTIALTCVVVAASVPRT
ncbi:DUF6415 family natural product biosynthesis protein [Streptomyces sp. NPDC046821]|uniref:DUF6415 family natural product biosynthesis protein n=1 Tax=Streptomyces sp. NPDC046821 TaxID=3154702 RepID=UPI0033D357FE